MNRQRMKPELLTLMAFLWIAGTVLAAGPSEKEILDGADARIEKHRKADLSLVIKDASGSPVANAEIVVEQTRHAFLFGSNIFMLGRCASPTDNAKYEQRFAALLNYATAPFYWWAYEKEQGKPDHGRTEEILTWCKAHGVAVKGHPLMWNYHDPAWLPNDLAAVRKLQLDRITDCVQKFRGSIDRWDVVNEAANYEREMCLKNSPKVTAAANEIGRMDFIRQAFLTARKANPVAVLLINDYEVEPPYANDVIAKLVGPDSKPLYDVIGIQSHQHAGAWPATRIWEICERYAKFGVPLHFTETTFVSGEPGWDIPRKRKNFNWISTPDGEARQKQDVVRFYTTLFSHPAVEAITWWDFADYHAWQQAPAGLIRNDLSPKPAYEALMKLIKGEWWTKTTIKTDDQGRATFRGFLGDYTARFTADGHEQTRVFTLKKGQYAAIELRAGQ